MSNIKREKKKKEMPDRLLPWQHYEIFTRMPNNATVNDMQGLHVIEYHEWGCMRETLNVGFSRNRIQLVDRADFELQSTLHSRLVRGTTFYINEWQQVGHSQLDSELIQALASTKIDQVILQRAPCGGKSPDLCFGAGYWIPWFRGFYGLLMKAFYPFLIYTRWVSTPSTRAIQNYH